jgi:subtilisin family serine protease
VPTTDELLQNAATWFFETALPESTGKHLADLDSPLVHVGQYTAWSGAAVQTSMGTAVEPAFALLVGPALPITDGAVPALAPASPDAAVATTHLLWNREVADPQGDDVAEITRVMIDLDSFAEPFGQAALPSDDVDASTTPPEDGASPPPPDDGASPPPPDDGASPPPPDGTDATATSPDRDGVSPGAVARAAQWAAAIVASRAELGGNISSLTAVPSGLQSVAADVETVRAMLTRYCTFDADGNPYPRWSGAGRDGTNPAHLTDVYKQNNALEVQLGREEVYLYAVVPESLLTKGGDLQGGVFREVVLRFDPTDQADRPFSITTLHTARWRRDAAAHHDFVFFYATEGTGIPVARAVRARMSPSVVQFLDEAQDAGDERQSFLEQSPVTVALGNDAAAQVVPLVVLVDGEANPLPADIAVSGDPPALTALVPPERVAEVAATPGVRHVELVAEAFPSNDVARAGVHVDLLTAKIAADKRGGKGVVVGVIDSGIDGSHLAFAGRLHAVWDMGNPTLVTGQTPLQRHPGNTAYDAFNFGVELEGTTGTASVGLSQDANGHGTHVASIAAGAEVVEGGVVTCPGGVAPSATIVAVRAIGVGANSWLLGVRWIAQKASELGFPFVINMSFESHQHGHDGSDPNALFVFSQLVDSAKNYRPGRIVVAAAGNQRSRNIHTRRRLPRLSGVRRLGSVQLGNNRQREVLEIWVRNPQATAPASFPMTLFARRQVAPGAPDFTPATQLPGSTTTVFPALRTRILIASQIASSVNGDFVYRVTFTATGSAAGSPDPTPTMVAALWDILLINGSMHELDLHGWVTRSPERDIETRSEWVGATHAEDLAYVVGSPATSAAAVSVASINSRLTFTTVNGAKNVTLDFGNLGDISAFSSNGPLRASSIAPNAFYGTTHEINGVDVSAPGCVLRAALSAQGPQRPHRVVPAPPPAAGATALPPRSQMMQGTSMASPVVAGLVACLLADKPSLTLPQVLALLKGASAIPATTAHPPPPSILGMKPLSRDWGYGLVDANLLK